MPFSNEASSNPDSQSKKYKFIKWAAILTTIIFAVLYAIVSAFLVPSMGIAFLMSMGAPGASLFLGILWLLLILVLCVLPVFVLILLFYKKKYFGIILFNLVIVVLIGVFGGDYVKRPLEVMAGKAGLSLPNSAPAGILTLSDEAIPKGYFVGENGKVIDSFGKRTFSSALYSELPPKGIIRLMYPLHRSACNEFASMEYEEATCKIGKCVTHISSSARSDGKTNFQSKDVSFVIDDNGSCVQVSFSVSNEKEALTQEQMMNVVDSLERVPGQFVPDTEDQGLPTDKSALFKTQIMNTKLSLESSREKNGLYKDIKFGASATLRDGDCISTLHLDVAPDGSQYILHRPTCPDTKQSYCIENGQSEISTVSTSLIQKTYHCK